MEADLQLFHTFPRMMMTMTEKRLLPETFPFTILGSCYFCFHFHDDGWKPGSSAKQLCQLGCFVDQASLQVKGMIDGKRRLRLDDVENQLG